MKQILTASKMTCFLGCFRKYYYRYRLMMKLRDKQLALRFGTAWHLGMEARWKGMSYNEALAYSLPDSDTLDAQQGALLSAMLAAYYSLYGDTDSTVKTTMPEVSFQFSLPQSRTFLVSGIIDGLSILHDGRLAMVEHKTTSDSIAPESDYWMRLRSNIQLLMYVDAAIRLGHRPAYVIYDVVRKSELSPKQIPELDQNGLKIILNPNGNRVFLDNGKPRQTPDKEAGQTLKARSETPMEYSQRIYDDIMSRPEYYLARREVPIMDDDLAAFQVQRLTIAQWIHFACNQERTASKAEHAWPRNITEMNCKFCEYSSFCLNGIEVTPETASDRFTFGRDQKDQTTTVQPNNPEKVTYGTNITATAALIKTEIRTV